MDKVKNCWNCNAEVPYQEYENITFIPKCPKCGVSYPEKPKDEALLSIYQDEYLNDRSDKNLNRLFNLINKVTFNIICHKLKGKSSYEQIDDIWDKVQWTLERLMKYYREKPDFKIGTSFIQYISQVVLYPLYNKEEKERKKKEISIHTPKYNKDKNKELFDYLSKDDDGGMNETENCINNEFTQTRISDESIKFIKTVIESIYEYEKDENTNNEFKNSLYMAVLFKYFIYGECDDKLVEEIMNSLDFDLIKKFEKSKEMYKEVLIKYATYGEEYE